MLSPSFDEAGPLLSLAKVADAAIAFRLSAMRCACSSVQTWQVGVPNCSVIRKGRVPGGERFRCGAWRGGLISRAQDPGADVNA